VLLILTILLSGCASPTSSPTALPASDEPESQRMIVEVPPGTPATIDGTFSPGEWDDAMLFTIDAARKLYLMHRDGYLYLGIDSGTMGYGSICIAQDDQISILHASAALGMAVFERDGSGWQRIRQFSWCCRETSPGPRQTQHLQEEGWLASIGYMGVSDEMEYQIAMPEGGLTMAVVYQAGRSVTGALRWPDTIDDDCLGLVGIADDPPERLEFSPETWPLLITVGE
jgi:hypothetical protein